MPALNEAFIRCPGCPEVIEVVRPVCPNCGICPGCGRKRPKEQPICGSCGHPDDESLLRQLQRNYGIADELVERERQRAEIRKRMYSWKVLYMIPLVLPLALISVAARDFVEDRAGRLAGMASFALLMFSSLWLCTGGLRWLVERGWFAWVLKPPQRGGTV